MYPRHFLRNFASMKKILTILAAVFAIACSGGKTTIYDFTAESNSGEQVNFKDRKGRVVGFGAPGVGADV